MGKTIGVVGGAGPFAGIDLLTKILEQTAANRDQEHLTVINYSGPRDIPDRSEYLLGTVEVNPAEAIAGQLLQMEQLGVSVAGIPCNTAHASPIFTVIQQRLAAAGSKINFLNMAAEVGQFLRLHYPMLKRVGVLSTTGTYRSGVYSHVLGQAGFQVLMPDETLQTAVVHPAIYDPDYGVKACGKATPQSAGDLRRVGKLLQSDGAEAIVLGCTEIPIAITEKRMGEMIVVDPTLILARALIREASPEKLRPWEAG